MNIKTLVATAILASALASPALAHTATVPTRVGIGSPYVDEDDPNSWLRATKRSYELYHNGKYVGSTPDPNIRQQLQREYDEW